MAQMTEAEWKAFVSGGTLTAKAATTRADGRPHVTPIWFALDGGDILFTTGGTSVKAKSLRRDPRIALCIDDQTPPYTFVLIEGTASMSEDPGNRLHWATVIGGRYMGQDRAEEYGRRNGVPGEVLVRVTPTKVVAEKDIAD